MSSYFDAKHLASFWLYKVTSNKGPFSSSWLLSSAIRKKERLLFIWLSKQVTSFPVTEMKSRLLICPKNVTDILFDITITSYFIDTILKFFLFMQMSRESLILTLPCKLKFCCSDLYVFKFSSLDTVKALLSPRGAYLILDTPEGGLLERGAYSKS